MSVFVIVSLQYSKQLVSVAYETKIQTNINYQAFLFANSKS